MNVPKRKGWTRATPTQIDADLVAVHKVGGNWIWSWNLKRIGLRRIPIKFLAFTKREIYEFQGLE